ncbi:tail fiber assembly protein [Citrobacter enshiensis]|uniref:tail fiber assembly protein n=1 Tax=Citrobacter enshiensis TaxID=2971264 RepID=UPI0023E75845|nr:tail fiber assembly protein [Citrobacter enshiensis]WET41723.1 tail fiber assembly protein [Citrobacter enshiensis]
MAKATLNKNGIATKAGDITVYNYDSETREYLSSAVEFLAVGVGIPASSCTDAPVDEKDGFAICRTVSLDGWEYVTDHRGETVYDKQTSQPVEITSLGDYPGNVTTVVPSTPYDRWNGSAWVTDKTEKTAAEIAGANATKAALIKNASVKIVPLQDAVELDMATDEEKSRYDAWRKYRVLLTRVDTSQAPDISWPEPPED